MLFGEITGHTISLNRFGEIVKLHWEQIPSRCNNVSLDSCIVMPNHLHCIIIINTQKTNVNVGAGYQPAHNKFITLPEIIRNFKTSSSTSINKLRSSRGVPVWQRNYFDRVIRNDEELYVIREYIKNNINNWKFDIENPNLF